MSFVNEYGSTIKVGNTRPKNYSHGGYIPEGRTGYTSSPFRNELIDRDEDTVQSLLQTGNVVIPRSIVPLMRMYRGPIVGKGTNDRSQLQKVIIQPKEIVVAKENSDKVLNYLRSKGVKLPLVNKVIF
jgi:hypothetical protein